MLVKAMTTFECVKLLDAHRLCRLACVKDGQPYVVPIYFAHAANYLYAFSMPGKKIDLMRANPKVAVVVEDHSQGRQWRSVVVDGFYQELPDRIGSKLEREHAWSLLSKHTDWWEPGAFKPAAQPLSDHSPHVFFRISIEHVSGREAREEGQPGAP
jgi:nitroimidazol reductase NimA-like FMN-containing flavoprotein (pyridoxamine 5'-phosphate oxidase superfamily)